MNLFTADDIENTASLPHSLTFIPMALLWIRSIAHVSDMVVPPSRP